MFDRCFLGVCKDLEDIIYLRQKNANPAAMLKTPNQTCGTSGIGWDLGCFLVTPPTHKSKAQLNSDVVQAEALHTLPEIILEVDNHLFGIQPCHPLP